MKAKILCGDVRTKLQEIPTSSIQACITSPPYWGLRDYGHDGQIGLEQTPEEYVAEMVAVFREVRRVLKDDGVLWLNLGDSYNGAAMNRSGQHGYDDGRTNRSKRFSAGGVDGLKPKDLVGIPWRVAFALQADGWWLRQDIIWHKPNPMPESVTDRCTKAHEYLFLLTKSAKYYFDNEAIKEESNGKWNSSKGFNKTGQSLRNIEGRIGNRDDKEQEKRNRRSVWTIPTKPFRGAHFAVMPEALVEPCILATSRPNDTILDPFTGSGTVAVVALRHNRNFIGTELNPSYANIAHTRIREANPLFNDITIT